MSTIADRAHGTVAQLRRSTPPTLPALPLCPSAALPLCPSAAAAAAAAEISRSLDPGSH